MLRKEIEMEIVEHKPEGPIVQIITGKYVSAIYRMFGKPIIVAIEWPDANKFWKGLHGVDGQKR